MSALVVYFLYPETNGLSLEGIDVLFAQKAGYDAELAKHGDTKDQGTTEVEQVEHNQPESSTKV